MQKSISRRDAYRKGGSLRLVAIFITYLIGASATMRACVYFPRNQEADKDEDSQQMQERKIKMKNKTRFNPIECGFDRSTAADFDFYAVCPFEFNHDLDDDDRVSGMRHGSTRHDI